MAFCWSDSVYTDENALCVLEGGTLSSGKFRPCFWMREQSHPPTPAVSQSPLAQSNQNEAYLGKDALQTVGDTAANRESTVSSPCQRQLAFISEIPRVFLHLQGQVLLVTNSGEGVYLALKQGQFPFPVLGFTSSQDDHYWILVEIFVSFGFVMVIKKVPDVGTSPQI